MKPSQLEISRHYNRGRNAIGVAQPRGVEDVVDRSLWEDELEGFQSGAEQVPMVDLVALGARGIRFFPARRILRKSTASPRPEPRPVLATR
jgi:hypothetical protein